MKEKLLISACLCGKNTKYSGGNNLIERLDELQQKYDLYLICPEVDGGLTTPRNPSEQLGEKVVSNKGVDVTNEFNLGSKIALEVALKNNIKNWQKNIIQIRIRGIKKLKRCLNQQVKRFMKIRSKD